MCSQSLGCFMPPFDAIHVLSPKVRLKHCHYWPWHPEHPLTAAFVPTPVTTYCMHQLSRSDRATSHGLIDCSLGKWVEWQISSFLSVVYLEKGRKCQYPYSLTHHQKCNSWNLTQFLYSFNTTQLQKVQPFKGSKGEKGGQRCKPLSKGHTGSRKMSRDPKPPGVWGHLGLYSFWSQLQHSRFLLRLFKMRKSPCKTAPSR